MCWNLQAGNKVQPLNPPGGWTTTGGLQPLDQTGGGLHCESRCLFDGSTFAVPTIQPLSSQCINVESRIGINVQCVKMCHLFFVDYSTILKSKCVKPDYCRCGNDIKFNWRLSIKPAIKTASTQRNPARMTFCQPPLHMYVCMYRAHIFFPFFPVTIVV